MCRGKIISFIFALSIANLFCATIGNSQEEPTATSASSKKKSVKNRTSTEFGISYSMWNEELKISQAGESEVGFANYAGFGFVIDKSWTLRRWLYGGTLNLGVGKMSSGGFEDLSYPDGVNRSWLAATAHVYSLHRLNRIFNVGLGLMGRQLKADWTAEDDTLTVTPAGATQAALQFILRWKLTKQISLVQTYTPLNFGTSTMWNWTLQSSL